MSEQQEDPVIAVIGRNMVLPESLQKLLLEKVGTYHGVYDPYMSTEEGQYGERVVIRSKISAPRNPHVQSGIAAIIEGVMAGYLLALPPIKRFLLPVRRWVRTEWVEYKTAREEYDFKEERYYRAPKVTWLAFDSMAALKAEIDKFRSLNLKASNTFIQPWYVREEERNAGEDVIREEDTISFPGDYDRDDIWFAFENMSIPEHLKTQESLPEHWRKRPKTLSKNMKESLKRKIDGKGGGFLV